MCPARIIVRGVLRYCKLPLPSGIVSPIPGANRPPEFLPSVLYPSLLNRYDSHGGSSVAHGILIGSPSQVRTAGPFGSVG